MIHEHQFGELAILTTSRSEARTIVVVILNAVMMVVERIGRDELAHHDRPNSRRSRGDVTAKRAKPERIVTKPRTAAICNHQMLKSSRSS